MAKKKKKHSSSFREAVLKPNIPATQEVTVVPAYTAPKQPVPSQVLEPQAISGSVDHNGTVSGLTTTALGTVSSNGTLKGFALYGQTYGNTVNDALRCRLEVTKADGSLVWAIGVSLAGAGQHAEVATNADLPVLAGYKINLVSSVNQTTPCRTRFFGYVALQPYV